MAENIRPYIIINGKNSMEVSGLLITKLPPITKPQMRVTAEEIDGRDGDIVTELGFSAYDKEIEIGLAGDYDVNDVIEYFNQSGIITFSNEPDKYYKFAQYDAIDFDKLIRFKKAKVNFHVQPFKFSTESNDDVIYAPTSFNVTNEGNIYSKPEIALQGSGNVGIVLNGSQALSINLGETKQAIVIDSNDMNAYGTKSNIKELITEINPVQDLHGYNQPWIGGAGKNILNCEDVTITQEGYVIDNVSVNMPAGNYVLSFDFSGTSNSASLRIDDNNGNAIFTYAGTLSSGKRTYNITLPQDGYKIKYYTMAVGNYSHFMLEKGSTATSFEPYENICPISGWNGCDISRCGINLWDEVEKSGYTISGAGVETPATNAWCSQNYIPLVPNTTYYLKSSSYLNARWYDADKNYLGYSVLGANSTFNSTSAFANARYLRFNGYGTTYNNDISVNYPATDTDYHAYVGSKYQSFFEGLIAGTYGFVDLGSLTWTKVTDYPEFRASYSANNIPDGKAQAQGSVKSNLICTNYPAMSTNETYRGANTGISLAPAYISVGDDTYSDADAFTEAMSGKYLIYELASNTTPSITQEDINMLISAFNADLVCVVFGQEVYAGSLNVTTGLLTINHAGVSATSSDNIGGIVHTYNNGWAFTLVDKDAIYKLNGEVMSNINAVSGYQTATKSGFCYAISSKKPLFFLADSDTGLDSSATFAQVQNAFSLFCNNYSPFAIYELDNPVEIQLTAQDVMTLIGKNNIMSNTGAISELIYTHAGADVTTSGDIVSFDVDVGDIKDNILKNRLVTGNYDNLRLKIGTNQLGVSGDVDVIVLSNFSRWL